jgi:hypothetical protein
VKRTSSGEIHVSRSFFNTKKTRAFEDLQQVGCTALAVAIVHAPNEVFTWRQNIVARVFLLAKSQKWVCNIRRRRTCKIANYTPPNTLPQVISFCLCAIQNSRGCFNCTSLSDEFWDWFLYIRSDFVGQARYTLPVLFELNVNLFAPLARFSRI